MTILKRSVAALLMALLLCACTKPTENIKIVIDTNVIKYSVLIHVTDASNFDNPPAGLTMVLSGQDAGQIYEISGSKSFNVTSGIIAVGPTPALVPAADKPIQFTLTVYAPGYSTITEAITINTGQTQQVVSITMARLNTAGGGVSITQDGSGIDQPASATMVTLNFVGTCANKPDVELHPSDYIFYRETGATTGYRYLGYMVKGSLTAPLVLGKTYDFEMIFNGVAYVVSQKIDQTSYTESIVMGTNLCSTF